MSTLTNYEGLLALSTSPHITQVMRDYLVSVLAEHREMSTALRWIVNDAAYKAPEEVSDVCRRWITVANAALAKVEA